MRHLIYIFALLHFGTYSQVSVDLLLEELPNDSVLPLTIGSHSSVKPAINWNRPKDGLLNIGSKSKSSVGFLNPLLDLNYRFIDDSQYRLGGGIGIESNFEKKWYYRANIVGGVGNGDSTFRSNGYIVNGDSANYSYLDMRGRISFSPNEVFNFQVGLDHNFIGEGNRSLFLSDYGKPYPFGQIRTRFWRLEYTIMYQFYKEQAGDKWRNKNGATHYISFNAAKWLNIGIFETVIFQPKDTVLNRGYDAEYLNPVIFYRPQEYSLGSSDNVLLGASFTVKYKKHTLYGQIIIDEFSLVEVKAKSGWWATKYGWQLGIKGRFQAGKTSIFYRTEYNIIRPYTYSHINSGQNYGNQGMTLSHPLGSNFMELLGEIKAQRGKWSLKTFVSYSLQGLDKDGFSYGANVYEPYTNRPYEYNHYISQGLGNNTLRAIVTFSYQIHQHGNLQAFFENHLRYDSAFERTNYIPVIGLRSQLWNDYRNY